MRPSSLSARLTAGLVASFLSVAARAESNAELVFDEDVKVSAGAFETRGFALEDDATITMSVKGLKEAAKGFDVYVMPRSEVAKFKAQAGKFKVNGERATFTQVAAFNGIRTTSVNKTGVLHAGTWALVVVNRYNMMMSMLVHAKATSRQVELPPLPSHLVCDGEKALSKKAAGGLHEIRANDEKHSFYTFAVTAFGIPTGCEISHPEVDENTGYLIGGDVSYAFKGAVFKSHSDLTGYFTTELAADGAFPDADAASFAAEKQAGFPFKGKKPEEVTDKKAGTKTLSYATDPNTNLTLVLTYKSRKLIKIGEHVTVLGDEGGE